MKKYILRVVIFMSLVPQFILAANTDYCVAFRGNAEGMPAHWGAMSAVAQEKGLPTAMAGGSSASITIFLLESLALNKLLKTNSEKALMIKSFLGYFETLTQTPESKTIAALLADKKVFEAFLRSANNLENLVIAPQTMMLLQKHLTSLETLMTTKDFIELLNPDFLLYVQTTLAMTQALNKGAEGVSVAQVAYRKDQISKTIKNFGKLDPATDEALFLRPGLISFPYLAKVMGHIGDFYAGVKLQNLDIQRSVEADLTQFLAACTPGSEKLSWRELIEQRPICRQLLGRSILTYRVGAQKERSESVRIHEKVGAHLATFPITSVLIGSAAQDFKKLKAGYLVAQDSSYGQDFVISQEELKFGYWGSTDKLKNIETRLKTLDLTKNDEKSKKFLSLGDTTWLEALSLSPAEPTYSGFVDINETMISAGGWNDLHPTLILKAHGCEDIVYVTRRGGDSMFAQGVIHKLTKIDGFRIDEWSGITAYEYRQKNALGNATDIGPNASLWSKLYNIANPLSSFRISMKAATTVVCSDWDRYVTGQDMNALVEDAFRAPWLTDKNELCR